MRNLLNHLLFLIAFITLSLPLTSHAQSTPSYEVTMLQTDDDTEPEPKPNNKGKRTPTKPITIIITTEGLHSPIESLNIVAYEIWSDVDECIFSGPEENMFIELIYSLQGTYTLRVLTTNKNYIGYIDL